MHPRMKPKEPLLGLLSAINTHILLHRRLGLGGRADGQELREVTTEGPSWGYPRCGLGAICGNLSPKVDEIFQKMTFD